MILDVSNPLEIMVIAIGVIGVLKKVAEMERYDDLRAWVLTMVIFLVFSVFWFALVNSYEDRFECDCADTFTLSEM
jgi:hypothetical protein